MKARNCLVVSVKYTAVTTDNMTGKILSSELKKNREKDKHVDLEVLAEKAHKTPVFTNKNFAHVIYLVLFTSI